METREGGKQQIYKSHHLMMMNSMMINSSLIANKNVKLKQGNNQKPTFGSEEAIIL